MWSLIYIDYQTNPDTVLRLIDMAKSARLNIRISGSIFDERKTAFKEAIAAAAVKADQWETLFISGYSMQMLDLYESMPRVLPGLDSAHICHTIPTDTDQLVPAISAPNLRRFIVNGNSQFVLTDCLDLQDLELVELSESWGSIGVVWAEKVDGYFIRLAGAFPALESLSLDFRDYTGRDHHSEEDIPNPTTETAWPPFPRLKALSFNRPTPYAIEYFLRQLRDSNPTILEFTGVDGRKYPHPRPLRMPPSCRFLWLYEQSLHSIRLFVSAFSDLSRVLVEVADTRNALGVESAPNRRHYAYMMRARWDDNDQRSERDIEQAQSANRIKEDWGFISSNAKVRWHFPRSPLEEGVEGIGVGKAVVYACRALISSQKESFGPANLGTRKQRFGPWVDVHTNTDPAKIRHQIERVKSACLDVRLLPDYKNFYHPYNETTFGAATPPSRPKLTLTSGGAFVSWGGFPGLEELYSWVSKDLPRLSPACVEATFDHGGEYWAPVISTPSPLGQSAIRLELDIISPHLNQIHQHSSSIKVPEMAAGKRKSRKSLVVSKGSPEAALPLPPAATTRALSIPEILISVLSLCENADLGRAALTCRRWSPVALDHPWRELDSFLPLLFLVRPLRLVLDTEEKKIWEFEGNVADADW
ncbi:hypothetical protein FRC00_008143, partial [Tulasnella sp. 408]